MDMTPSSLWFLFTWMGGGSALWYLGSRYKKSFFSLSTGIPAFLFCLSVHVLYLSLQFESLPGDTSAGTVPLAMAALLSVLSFIQIINEARLQLCCAPQHEAKPSSARPLAILVAIAGYLLLIPYLGFYMASALFLLASFFMLGARSVPRMIAITSLWGLLVFFLFSSVLKVPLPEGVFF